MLTAGHGGLKRREGEQGTVVTTGTEILAKCNILLAIHTYHITASSVDHRMLYLRHTLCSYSSCLLTLHNPGGLLHLARVLRDVVDNDITGQEGAKEVICSRGLRETITDRNKCCCLPPYRPKTISELIDDHTQCTCTMVGTHSGCAP